LGLRFYFAAHRPRRCRADKTPRTGIGLPPRTAGSTIAFPKAVSAYAGLYALSLADWTRTTILRRILLTTRIDVSTTPTVFSIYYTNGVFISVPDNPIGVPDNPRKRDFHRCTYAVLGG